MRYICILLSFITAGSSSVGALMQQRPTTMTPSPKSECSRRSLLFSPAALAVGLPLVVHAAFFTTPTAALAADLKLTEAPTSGLKWADAKIGSGVAPEMGSPVSIDLSMASTGGRFPKIFSTQERGAPYRWRLGDGSTIQGIEKAIIGGEDGIPPMLPGGIRRVIVPAKLGYEALAVPNASCVPGEGIGPLPPTDDIGATNRFKQLYCNPRIPYQPDLVLDIKLYGKRSLN